MGRCRIQKDFLLTQDLRVTCCNAPRCLPDAGEILRARLQQEVQERMVDLLDRSLGIERPETETTETEDDQQTDDEPEPSLDNLRDEILNRALDRIFN